MKKNRHLFWLVAAAFPLGGLIIMANGYVFPQAIPLACMVMLSCWGAHVLLFALFLVGMGRKGLLRPIGLVAIGLLDALCTVGFVGYACYSSPDQEFVQAWDAPGGPTHVEVFHIGMHDHMATQVFWGGKVSPFASDYHFQDHFRVENIDVQGDVLYIYNGVQAETLVLDMRTHNIQLKVR